MALFRPFQLFVVRELMANASAILRLRNGCDWIRRDRHVLCRFCDRHDAPIAVIIVVVVSVDHASVDFILQPFEGAGLALGAYEHPERSSLIERLALPREVYRQG